MKENFLKKLQVSLAGFDDLPDAHWPRGKSAALTEITVGGGTE